MEDFEVVVPERGRQMFLPAPMFPAALDFVIADPDDNTRMITQPFDVIYCFVSYIVEKCLIARVHAAGKNEIKPDEDHHFVAKIIEIVSLVNAATPNTQHVHVGITHRFQELAVFILGDARGETVSGNPIATLGENRHAIDHKIEALAGRIWLLPEFERSQAAASSFLIYQFAVDQQSCFKVI